MFAITISSENRLTKLKVGVEELEPNGRPVRVGEEPDLEERTHEHHEGFLVPRPVVDPGPVPETVDEVALQLDHSRFVFVQHAAQQFISLPFKLVEPVSIRWISISNLNSIYQ